ncbi:methyltransferase [Pseudoduganella namucuonensis]|uniref:HemK family putative methylases n=1 Tax=Pseudoduganella namucuonensis TaxID=1035707 RepID=A0A1I7M3B1_9BURK|nr:class I SAM-dependent methyltransferase [Pseudoduganella namucuonensis]SFV16442.1 HemK family putative methylases [Pseudoduganella namucuonensis]
MAESDQYHAPNCNPIHHPFHDQATSPRPGGLDRSALLEAGRILQALDYRFTTVTPATQARVLAREPDAWARGLRDVFGWSRPYHAGVLPPELAALMSLTGLAKPHGDGWRSTVRCSSLGERLYFHSAYPTGDADAVFFGPDTSRFIRALNHELTMWPCTPQRIADLGCGSGAAAIELARRFRTAEVLAVDINDAALAITEVNAALAGVSNVWLLHSDLLAQAEGGFDLIVANPPYLLDAAERSYRHGGGALGEGLALRIVDTALRRLRPGGTLMLYTGVAMVDGEDPFLEHVKARLAGAPCRWRYQEIDPDVFGEELELPAYAGAERIAAVWLTVTLD